MIHLRGQNGTTQCGKTIPQGEWALLPSNVRERMKDAVIVGLGGFRLAHGTNPERCCLVCLEKSHHLKRIA